MSKGIGKYINTLSLKALALAALISFVFFTNAYAQALPKDSDTSKNPAFDFGQGSDWMNNANSSQTPSDGSGQPVDAQTATSTCDPMKDGSGKTPCPSGVRNDIDPSCLEANNKNSCLNTMPTSNVDRVPEDVCYRVSGAGGNSTPRQHHGMDYSSPAGTIVYAAADGWVRSNECSSGYGRVIHMTHSLGGKLQTKDEFQTLMDSANTNAQDFNKNTYRTVYAHLSKILVSSGFVTKGTPIGLIGGSNCKNGKVIDPAYDSSGKRISNGAYGNHLHFEIRGGDSKNSGGATFDPMCSNIQGLCGGKTVNTTQCRKNCKEAGAKCQASSYGEGAMNAGDQTAEATRECDFNTYMRSFDQCIFCGIFKVLFNTASIVAQKAFDAIAAGMQSIIIIGTALWLAYKVLMFVAAVEVKEPRAFLKEILSQLFVVFVVYVLLSMSPSEFMALALEPIFNTGFELSRITLAGVDNLVIECASDYGIMEDGGLPQSMGYNIVCTLDVMQKAIGEILAMGMTSICIGFYIESYKQIFIFPHLGYVVIGLLLWISGFLLLIIYPFLLVDAVLKLCVAAGLLPAAIGAYAFKITRGYVGNVFKTILNAMLSFVFLTLIIFLIKVQLFNVIKESGLDEAIRNGEGAHQSLMDQLSWVKTAPLKIVFIIFLGWAVLGESDEFASEFASGLGPSGKNSIGRNVGGLAVNSAEKVGGWAGKIGKNAVKSTGRNISNMAKERYHGVKNNLHGKWIQKTGVDNGDGSYTRSTRRWKLVPWSRKVEKTLNSDGTISRKETSKKFDRNMFNDGFIKADAYKLKNGLQTLSTEMLTAGGKSLSNKDGTVDLSRRRQLKAGSKGGDDLVDTAIMQQLLDEKMPGYSHGLRAAFQDRNINRGVDDNGNETFEIVQINADGSETKFKMTINENTERVMLEVAETNARGDRTDIHATDGIVNKRAKVDRWVDNDGNIVEEEKAEYAFSDYYSKYASKPMDSLGVTDRNIPYHETLFSQRDQDAIKDQFYYKGKNANLRGFN